jgi:hypothetical protein
LATLPVGEALVAQEQEQVPGAAQVPVVAYKRDQKTPQQHLRVPALEPSRPTDWSAAASELAHSTGAVVAVDIAAAGAAVSFRRKDSSAAVSEPAHFAAAAASAAGVAQKAEEALHLELERLPREEGSMAAAAAAGQARGQRQMDCTAAKVAETDCCHHSVAEAREPQRGSDSHRLHYLLEDHPT